MAPKPEEAAPTAAIDAVPAAEEKHAEPAPKAEKKPEEKTDPSPPTEALANLDVSDKTEPTEAPTPAAAAPVPTPAETATTQDATATTTPTWPETPPEHPLTKFIALLPDLLKEASHNEVYGITLDPTTSPFHTRLILQKFLRANQNDLDKARQQLLETLKWRHEFDPVKAVTETFAQDRFAGLGYVLQLDGVPESPNAHDVVTFNIYGAVKDNAKTFGDLDGFLRWRVGLMERSVQKLNLAGATAPIPDYGQGPDSYQGFQVHDYLQVSFLRQDPVVKAATKRTIEILGRYYPETLSRKFFVNVPVVMGWLYQATKLVVAKETARKFTVLSYGEQLGKELGKGVPKVYGGEAGELSEVGEGMELA